MKLKPVLVALAIVLSVAATSRILCASESASSKARDSGAGAEDVEAIKQEVMKLDEQVHEADARADTKFLEGVYADDLVWTARGDVLNKAQVLADFKTGNDKLQRIDHYDIQAHVYPNTVILTGRSKSTVEYKGKISKGPRLFTQVYVKLDGRWQLVSHQVSDVPAK